MLGCRRLNLPLFCMKQAAKYRPAASQPLSNLNSDLRDFIHFTSLSRDARWKTSSSARDIASSVRFPDIAVVPKGRHRPSHRSSQQVDTTRAGTSDFTSSFWPVPRVEAGKGQIVFKLSLEICQDAVDSGCCESCVPKVSTTIRSRRSLLSVNISPHSSMKHER